MRKFPPIFLKFLSGFLFLLIFLLSVILYIIKKIKNKKPSSKIQFIRLEDLKQCTRCEIYSFFLGLLAQSFIILFFFRNPWIGIFYICFPIFSFLSIISKVGDISIYCKKEKRVFRLLIGFLSFEIFLKFIKSKDVRNIRKIFDEIILISILSNFYFFSFFYFNIYKLNPQSFHDNIFCRSLCFVDFLHFSFITGSTLGYGDIIPIIFYVQLAVIFELIIFWLNVPIFITSLISVTK